MMEELLNEIAEGPADPEDICPDPLRLKRAIEAVMAGDVSGPSLAALLMGLRCRGERAEHLHAVVQVMLANAVPLPGTRPAGVPIVDTCGTGGDQHGMVNVSTAAALLAAAAGLKVAKHGNRSVSSRSGSADVLEALGFKLDCAPETSAAMLDELGFCFLFAPHYHPAMRHAGPTRREIKVRTIFNLAGPLSNPARATHQLVGVSDPNLVPVVARTLQLLGRQRALVVHGRNREDEISLTTVTEALELRADGTLKPMIIEPVALGLEVVEMADLVVDGPRDSAEKVRAVLEGRPGPIADITILNAAGVLYVADVAPDMLAAVDMVRAVQRSGRAAGLMEQLARRSHA